MPAREGADIKTPEGILVGRVTSGGFSPTLGRPIAMGYVEAASAAIGNAARSRRARQADGGSSRGAAFRPAPLSQGNAKSPRLSSEEDAAGSSRARQSHVGHPLHQGPRIYPIEGDTGTVGITDYAQSQLGDVVFVELPDIGKRLTKGDEAAVVESVKAASEVYAPVSGEVVAVNRAIEEEPGKVNADPAGEGWFLKIKLADKAELGDLMDEAAYRDFLQTIA